MTLSKDRRGRLGPFLVLILGWTTAVACRTPDVATELRLGVVVPLSGPLYERVGRAAREAAELAVLEVNEAGGLDVGGRRHRVAAVFEDNRDRPEVAVQAARKLLNQDGVIALVGPLLSRNALAVAPVAETMRLPMISPSASHPELTAGRRYVFRAALGDELQGRALARFAYGELGARRAAVLYDVASPYNRSFAEIFRKVFEEAGGRTVAFESYTTGEGDFSRPLARIRDAAPHVLVLPNYVDEVPLQARQAREAGIGATLLGGDTWDSGIYPTADDFEDSYYVDEWHLDGAGETAAAFARAYQDRHGRVPTSIAALTYDAFGLLFQAIRSEGSLDGTAIQRGLGRIEGFRGVTGTISFRDRGEPTKNAVIVRIHRGQARLYRHIEP